MPYSAVKNDENNFKFKFWFGNDFMKIWWERLIFKWSTLSKHHNEEWTALNKNVTPKPGYHTYKYAIVYDPQKEWFRSEENFDL